jgi:hypothetical protein
VSILAGYRRYSALRRSRQQRFHST